jgi:hypothetical protein
MCLREEKCREGRAQVFDREGLIFDEGAYGVARQSDMSEPSSKCVIPIFLTEDDLKGMNVSVNLTCVDIPVYAGPIAKLLDYVQQDYRILY